MRERPWSHPESRRSAPVHPSFGLVGSAPEKKCAVADGGCGGKETGGKDRFERPGEGLLMVSMDFYVTEAGDVGSDQELGPYYVKGKIGDKGGDRRIRMVANLHPFCTSTPPPPQ